MRTLNLGILAHVDAGKTSLTERLLFSAGVIDEIGKVDAGNTKTDTLALERQRGITIQAAVVTFVIGDVTVNLVDTPGHPDFIAEVERALTVLDGAVLVVSSVEGVQPQTRILMRALKRLRVPALIFVNKIDRAGADCDAVFSDIRARLTDRAIAMGRVTAAGTRAAAFHSFEPGEEAFNTDLVNLLTEADDGLLEDYVRNPAALTPEMLDQALAHQVRECLIHPVFCGSAITGAGTEALIEAISHLLPAAQPKTGDPLSGVVFKVERGWQGDRIAICALKSGAVELRDQVALPDGSARVTGIQLYDGGGTRISRHVEAGRIAKLSGLDDIRVGDWIGRAPDNRSARQFAPPTLETRVVPAKASERPLLWLALLQMAEQDPLINLRRSDDGRDVFVSLFGEVQKEIIEQTLALDFGIEARLEDMTVICVERPVRIGEAREQMSDKANPYPATVGLRVEPGAVETGQDFRLEVDVGQMPAGFYRAVEEAVRETLRQGPFGWQVVDCRIAVTDLRYHAPVTTAGDFRELTPLVLASALSHAGSVVCEPIHWFHLECPLNAVGLLQSILAQAGAVIRTTKMAGDTAELEGEIAAARIGRVQKVLPGSTAGEGVLEFAFDHYGPVCGNPAVKPRSGPDPFDRDAYLHRVRHKLAVKRQTDA